MNLLADVIFPVFETPYVAPLLFPAAGITAILVEVFVFWLLNKHIELRKIDFVVLAANISSGLVGFLLASVLPSGLVPKVVDAERHISRFKPGPMFSTYLSSSFFIAFILSVAIEYGVIRLVARRVERPFLTVTLANLASYVALVVIAWYSAFFVQ